MPIQRVLSSARIIRLVAPGAPSLMETGDDAVAVLEAVPVRLTTVTLPEKRPSGWACCPATYMVDAESTALLAPPGIGSVQLATFATVEQFASSVSLVGSEPECCPLRKIIGDTCKSDTDEVDPPHSCPQFNM